MGVDGATSNFGAVSIGVAAAAVVISRGQRQAILVQNVHTSNDLFLGPNSTVTTANGLRLTAGQSIEIPTRGSIWAIASGASTDVRFWEIS